MSKAGSVGFWRCGRCGTPNPESSTVRNCVACGSPRTLVGQPITAGTTSPAAEPSRPTGMSRLGANRWLNLGSVIYLVIVLFVLGLITVFGGVFWPATLLLLGPRWVWLIPALALMVWAIQKKSKVARFVNGATLLLVLWPLMNFNIPLGGLVPRGEMRPQVVRLLSLNRGGAPIDADRLIRYIERYEIDVVCFQEIGKDPVLDDFLAKGWHREKDGYLASRHPILEEIPPPPEQNTDQERYTMSIRRLLVQRADGFKFLIASVHMPTLSRGLNGGIGVGFRPERFQAHVDWWTKEFGRLLQTLLEHQRQPMLIAGDLNMPPDHPTIRAIRRSGGLQSAYEERGWGYGYTKPSDWPWIRIDHILASDEWDVRRCWIGPAFGSDHNAIIAEFAFPAGLQR